MKTTVKLDASNRIVLSRELRRAAGVPLKQQFIALATPGRIGLEMEPNSAGRLVKRGKLKVWTGAVPSIPLEEAVEKCRVRPIKFKDLLIAPPGLEVDMKELDEDLRRERESDPCPIVRP